MRWRWRRHPTDKEIFESMAKHVLRLEHDNVREHCMRCRRCLRTYLTMLHLGDL